MTRGIDWSHEFKRDHKREGKTHGQAALTKMLDDCFDYLLEDQPLPFSYRDHSLSGKWKNCRDCHLKPDLILLYAKRDADPDVPGSEDLLFLMRLGSHSEIFGK